VWPTACPLRRRSDWELYDSGCNVQQVGIGATDSLDSLRLLDVSRTHVRGEALQDVAKRFPNLFHLDLEVGGAASVCTPVPHVARAAAACN
jgi:hypothetical protein